MLRDKAIEIFVKVDILQRNSASYGGKANRRQKIR